MKLTRRTLNTLILAAPVAACTPRIFAPQKVGEVEIFYTREFEFDTLNEAQEVNYRLITKEQLRDDDVIDGSLKWELYEDGSMKEIN